MWLVALIQNQVPWLNLSFSSPASFYFWHVSCIHTQHKHIWKPNSSLSEIQRSIFPNMLNYSFLNWAVHIFTFYSPVDTPPSCFAGGLHIFLPVSPRHVTHRKPAKKTKKKVKSYAFSPPRISGKIVTLRRRRFKNSGQRVSPAIFGSLLRIAVPREREADGEGEGKLCER